MQVCASVKLFVLKGRLCENFDSTVKILSVKLKCCVT